MKNEKIYKISTEAKDNKGKFLCWVAESIEFKCEECAEYYIKTILKYKHPENTRFQITERTFNDLSLSIKSY